MALVSLVLATFSNYTPSFAMTMLSMDDSTIVVLQGLSCEQTWIQQAVTLTKVLVAMQFFLQRVRTLSTYDSTHNTKFFHKWVPYSRSSTTLIPFFISTNKD